MKIFYLLTLSVLFVSTSLFAQVDGYPKGLTDDEIRFLQENGGLNFTHLNRGIESPPEFDGIRTMAEWEEIQVLTISWISYRSILKEIVRNAKEECLVLILSDNPNQTIDYLNSNNGGPALDNLDNVEVISADYNSIWMRDYAGNSVYGNEVDDLFMVDWIYNRPSRPDDDSSPEVIADYLGLDIYSTTSAPTDMVNTGGNFMSDGFGTGFASKLILEENEAGNFYGVSAKDEADIDQIMSDFMGIDRFIKMETLPYDAIHHIDMHMKLLNEHTLLMGEYPEGEADGPQINANLEYVLSNFNSMFDEPYDVIRIPMPDSPSGLFPDDNPAGYYRTYTNSVFINNTVLVPTYREQYDTTAMRIYNEALPGYNIVGIDCDDEPDLIIAASGALHCITHSIGVEDPLLISHQALPDTEDDINDYVVSAYVNHRSGVQSATLFYRTDEGGAYQEVTMMDLGENNWSAFIPAQNVGTEIDYYIHAEAISGKEQNRPMPAPEAYYRFKVLGEVVSVAELKASSSLDVFPNPANAITCIPVEMALSSKASITLYDVTGKLVLSVFEGNIPSGITKYFIDAASLNPGAYILVLQTEQFQISKRLMVN